MFRGCYVILLHLAFKKKLCEAQLPINKRTSEADIDVVFFKVQLNRGVNSQ